MPQRLAHVTLLVHDYDEAIDFYTRKLGFELRTDTALGGGKRWVLVAPVGSTESSSLLLARADNVAQRSQVGVQAGGRVCLFLTTDNFWDDYHRMQAQGVRFRELPREEAYATVVVFEDLYGNYWDLLQPR